MMSNDADYNVWLPLALVHEVNSRMKNSLYGYFVDKRLAFSVVELFVHNNWKKYGLKKVTMANGFFIFKFSSIKVFDSVFHDGPWMIREIPVFLNKWSPSMSLLKEELPDMNLFSLINLFETLNIENLVIEELATLNKATTFGTQEERQSTTPLAEKINVHEKQILEGKIVLLDDDGKPLEKVNYPGNTGSEDEVEQVDNETKTYLAPNLMRVGYGTKSLSEQLRVTAVDNDYDSYDDDVYECHDIFTTYRLYAMIELSREVVCLCNWLR
nr:zinc knuckle CX2CX4HX4C [Tanacetum cinerariifolium]